MAENFDDTSFDGIAASDSSDADELDGISLENPALDLTPQKRDDIKRGSKTLPALILVLLVVGIGGLLFQGLSGASLFIREADSAVADREELADRRFQLLGSPIAITEEEFSLDGTTAVRFSICLLYTSDAADE